MPALAQESSAPAAPPPCRVAPASSGPVAAPDRAARDLAAVSPRPGAPAVAGSAATLVTFLNQDFQGATFPPSGWTVENNDYYGTAIASEWEQDYWTYPSDLAAYCIGPDPYSTYAPTYDILYMTEAVNCLNAADLEVVFDVSILYPGLYYLSAVDLYYWSSRTDTWVPFYSIEGPGYGTYTGVVAPLPADAEDAEVKIGFQLYGLDDWDNVTIDDVQIRGTRSPDLLPYHPTTWPAPIVVSTSAGTSNQDAITLGQTVYVDFAAQNDSVESVASSTEILYDLLDGATLARGGVSYGIGANSFLTWQDLTYVFTTPGTHTLTLSCDTGAGVSEFDETNNDCQLVVNVLAPDLIVESGWLWPAEPNSFDSVFLGFNVRNVGDVVSPACHYSVLIDSVENASGTIPAVAAGGLDTHQGVALGSLSPGTHALQIVADALGEVTEANEGNNTFAGSLFVASPPDLWVEACRFQPASPNQTQQIVLEFDTRNSGGCASSTVDFVVREGAHALYQGRVMPVPAGGLATSQSIRVGPFAPGPHTLTIEVDSGHALAESNETNNAFDQPVTVQLVLKAGEAWMLY